MKWLNKWVFCHFSTEGVSFWQRSCTNGKEAVTHTFNFGRSGGAPSLHRCGGEFFLSLSLSHKLGNLSLKKAHKVPFNKAKSLTWVARTSASTRQTAHKTHATLLSHLNYLAALPAHRDAHVQTKKWGIWRAKRVSATFPQQGRPSAIKQGMHKWTKTAIIMQDSGRWNRKKETAQKIPL